ncbi:MAG: hypothetical protein AAF431_18070 [Pseudomonadota bacterium]
MTSLASLLVGIDSEADDHLGNALQAFNWASQYSYLKKRGAR